MFEALLIKGDMSILACVAVILVVRLVVGFLIETATRRFNRAGATPPLESHLKQPHELKNPHYVS
jgi:hypothetical protein